MHHPIQKYLPVQLLALISLVIVLTTAGVFAASPLSSPPRGDVVPVKLIDNSQMTPDRLEKLLAEADWQAIEEAKRIGRAGLQIIRTFLNSKNEQVLRIAMGCAGAIGDPDGADILVAGLRDKNFGVQLAAARELAEKRYPAAVASVLEILSKKSHEVVLAEMLAKAAGFFPGENTIRTLRPLAKGGGPLSRSAIFAMAKLGDAKGREALLSRLAARLPRIRYEALESLCYVNDVRFAATAKKLLLDKATALPIGLISDPQNRRVADQAVDSLVCLLKLQPPFETSSGKIYTDREISVLRNLSK